MILTPLPAHRLRAALAAFAAAMPHPAAARALRRIARSSPRRAQGATAESHRSHALALARSFRMGARPRAGRGAFGWDGRALNVETEAYVLLHEVAHFQLAPPRRRRVADFGLGPGPDTVDAARAERAATVHGAARDREEALASLLGILWETELRQPALASLLDQNWLEGARRNAAARHFASVFGRLLAAGYVGAAGRPTRRLRPRRDAIP